MPDQQKSRAPAALAMLVAAAFPLCTLGAVDSTSHPVLHRALLEHPDADQDGDGILSLGEYDSLNPKPPGHEALQDGKRPYLPVLPGGEVVIAAFEDNNFRNAPGWKSEGAAFQVDLNAGSNRMKRRVGPYEGKVFLTTLTTSDQQTGRLVSPEFVIELDYIVITISGGNFPQRVGVNLWLGQELVRSATGRNDDYFETVALEVGAFRGRIAKLELVDQHRGLWGHLNVDRLVMASSPGQARVIDTRPIPVSPSEGMAVTASGFQQGALVVNGGQLHSAGNSLVPETILLALNPVAPEPQERGKSLGSVRLIDGEIWRAEIRELQDDGLAIHSPLCGDRMVPLARIASIEFQPAPSDARRQPGHLYRTDGEPIPGKLVWVRQKDIAIDCALGILPIPRESVQRVVLANPEAGPDDANAIELADGSRLFGNPSFDGAELVVAHDQLGEVRLDWNAVRSVRRHSPAVDWLEKLPMTVGERIGPALPPPLPQWHAAPDEGSLQVLRVMPHTVVSFALETGPDRNCHFRTRLAPVPECRADLHVTIRAGERNLWEQVVRAAGAPVPVSLELGNAREVTIEVRFDGPLAFPGGIDLHDPHVLKLATIPSDPGQPN